jgi:hypothetical protein
MNYINITSRETLQYIYNIAEKTPQHFKDNHYISCSQARTNTTRIDVVITLCMSLTKYETITFIMQWQWLAAITPH